MNEDRRTYISSTEVAAVLGISQYNTPYEIWEKKTGKVSQDIPDNDVMLWGRLLEPIIRKEIEKRKKVKIGIVNPFVSDPNNPFLRCHPDGIDTFPKEGEINNEIKTVASWAYNKWSEPTPFEYYCQIQYEMYCARFTYPHITKTRFTILEMDARKLHFDFVHYDPIFCEKLTNQLKKFWNEHVLTNIPPDYQVSDFAKMNDVLDTYNEVNTEFISTIMKRKELNEQLKEIEESIDKIDEEIKLNIGESEGIRFGVDVLATWKSQTRTGVDTKKLKSEHPEVFENVKKKSEFRVLRIKG